MNAHHYGLILAGGRGTRFWPRSRKRSAKQVLNVVGERSLIQATVDRLAPVIPPERIWILTNDYLRETIVASFRTFRRARCWPNPRSATRPRPSAWRRIFCSRSTRMP